MMCGTPRVANSLSPVPSAARPSRTALRMLFSFTSASRRGRSSGDRQLAFFVRRLPDRVEEAMQIDRGVERGEPVRCLAGTDRLGEEAVHLPDVERVAAWKLRRHPGK